MLKSYVWLKRGKTKQACLKWGPLAFMWPIPAKSWLNAETTFIWLAGKKIVLGTHNFIDTVNLGEKKYERWKKTLHSSTTNGWMHMITNPQAHRRYRGGLKAWVCITMCYLGHPSSSIPSAQGMSQTRQQFHTQKLPVHETVHAAECKHKILAFLTYQYCTITLYI